MAHPILFVYLNPKNEVWVAFGMSEQYYCSEWTQFIIGKRSIQMHIDRARMATQCQKDYSSYMSAFMYIFTSQLATIPLLLLLFFVAFHFCTFSIGCFWLYISYIMVVSTMQIKQFARLLLFHRIFRSLVLLEYRVPRHSERSVASNIVYVFSGRSRMNRRRRRKILADIFVYHYIAHLVYMTPMKAANVILSNWYIFRS